MGHRIEIPHPVVDVQSIRARRTKSEKRSPEEIFFDRLARISDGNPGVAEHLWKVALDYPEVKNTLKDPPAIDLDRDESFALAVVLSMGSVDLGELSEVLGPLDLSAEMIAGILEERGLVSVDERVVSIRSEALKSVVEHLRRLRLVW